MITVSQFLEVFYGFQPVTVVFKGLTPVNEDKTNAHHWRTMTIFHRLRLTLHLLRHRTNPNHLAIMALAHTNTRQLIYEVWRKEPR